jgi:hypothetical protein
MRASSLSCKLGHHGFASTECVGRCFLGRDALLALLELLCLFVLLFDDFGAQLVTPLAVFHHR